MKGVTQKTLEELIKENSKQDILNEYSQPELHKGRLELIKPKPESPKPEGSTSRIRKR